MSTLAENKGINYQFKILYAIGMIMVVANHCGSGGVSLFYEFFPAYSFHMGLFIFCSGYFYKQSAEQNVGKYIFKKIKSLIIPLYVWNFIYALFAQLMSLRGFSFGVGVTFEQLIIGPITTGHQYIYNLASWFVVPLFMVEAYNIIFRKVISIIDKRVKEYVYIIVAVAIGMVGIWMASKGYNTGWWLVLTRLFYFIPFYCGGYFYKTILEKKDVLPNVSYFLIIIMLQLGIIIYKGGTLSYEQAWCKFSEFNVWPFVVGFLGIAFWLRIARMLAPVIGKSRVVNLIADNTFSIMVNQFIGFMLVKSIFALGYKYTNTLFQDFSWIDYHTNIWYYYLPGGLEQIRIIYVMVAIVVPIIIQLAVSRIREALCGKYNNAEMKKYILYLCICVVTGTFAYGIASYVQNNGGVQIPIINNYNLGTELLFDSARMNASKYCESGLSTPEKEFTWTDGSEADFSFTINDVESDLLLKLCCGVYGESQNMNLYVNNIFIGTTTITNNIYDYEMMVPYDVIKGSNLIAIKFELPDAISPLDKGEGADARVLGLSIKKIVIQNAE